MKCKSSPSRFHASCYCCLSQKSTVRWNTEYWTVYLSSKMLLARQGILPCTWDPMISVCTSTLLFLHSQISHCSSKKAFVTLDCKKLVPQAAESLTWTWINRFSFFKLHAWPAMCSGRHINVQDGHTWASSWYPDSTLGENTPSCITLILNWKPNRHQLFFLAKNQVQQYKDGPGAQSAV